MIKSNAIKYLTEIQVKELRESKLINSILEHTIEGRRYKFVFAVDGMLVERTYDNSFIIGSPNDPNMNRSCNKFMKIHLKNGSWKYGIVGFRKVDQTIGRKLMSIYVRKLRNPTTATWEWPGTLYNDAPDDALGKKMNFYCEDMERVVETRGISKLKKNFGTTLDYCKLYEFVNGRDNDFKRLSNRWIEVLPMGQTPYDIEGFHNMYVQKLKYHIPPSGYDRWNDMSPVFITHVKSQYLKSIYKDVKIRTWKKELFFLDDLLMILNPTVEDDDGNPVILWNSLDETCKGNV